MVPEVGALFAQRYRVEGILGEGGMGRVLAARSDDGMRVAIKVLLPEAAKNPEVVDRFLREAKSAGRIRGPNVARVYEVAPLEDGTPYMVMEHLDGSDLQTIIETRGAIPVAQAIDWVLEACEAVAEAHLQNLVHRDLKPANLFLARTDAGEVVKVLDFGISKSLDGSMGPSLAKTKTASFLGSPLYTSPEQLKNAKDVDERADIWALGVILFELISGHVPFDAETFAELSSLILSKDPAPRLEAAPPEVQRVVATCLAKDREDRWGNLTEFARALAPFGTERARASADRIGAHLGPPRRPSRPRLEALGQTAPMPPSSESSPSPLVDSAPISSREPLEPAPRPKWMVPAAAGMLALGAIGVAAMFAARSTPRTGQPLLAPPPPVISAPALSVVESPAPAPIESTQPIASASAEVKPKRPLAPPVPAAPTPRPRPTPSKDLFGGEN
jgi:serine/threonine-protein kinase